MNPREKSLHKGQNLFAGANQSLFGGQMLQTLNAIGFQNPGKVLQKLLDMRTAPACLVIVKDHRMYPTQFGCPVYKHVRLGIAGSVVLGKLTGGFVHLKYCLLTER